MAAHTDILGLLGQLGYDAQLALFELLGGTAPHLASLRLASRAARRFADGVVRQLTVARAGATRAVDGVFDWPTGLSRLEGVLARLPTRWPRCASLEVHLAAPDDVGIPQHPYTAVPSSPMRALVEQQGVVLQELLAAALVRHASGTRQLAALALHFHMQRVEVPLQQGFFEAIAGALPNLQSLTLKDNCGLSWGTDQQQEAAFRTLASLPRLSSLTLPGPAGLQHVTLLAGQLTRLVVHEQASTHRTYFSEGDQPLVRALRALPSLTRVTSMDLLGMWHWRPQDGLVFFSNLPPSLQQLTTYDSIMTWTGGDLDIVIRRPLGVGEVAGLALPLLASGLLRGGLRLRRLRVPELFLVEEPASHEEAAALRQLLTRCESVEVGRVSASEDTEPECFTQAAQLLAGLHGPAAGVRATVRLTSPGGPRVNVPLRLLVDPQREGNPPPDPPPPLGDLDLLRPLVCAGAEPSRHLLLLSGTLADRPRTQLQQWLRDCVSVHARCRTVEYCDVLCGVALKYGSSADAARVAQVLTSPGVTCLGRELLVLRTRALLGKVGFGQALAEVLRAYVEDNRDACGFEPLWAKGLSAWQRLNMHIDMIVGDEEEARVPLLDTWRRLAESQRQSS